MKHGLAGNQGTRQAYHTGNLIYLKKVSLLEKKGKIAKIVECNSF